MNKNKKIWVSVSAIVVVIALALVFGLTTNHAEKTSAASSNHETKAVKKTAIRKKLLRKRESRKNRQPQHYVWNHYSTVNRVVVSVSNQ
ncbi:hypothetical protein [Terrilactibacillus laevilacticus]|uniref:Uncharacterized protein n=1 Tax=Terrilactibacillus laevilacticus TaxID=1380157 RepID=A0ABW5PLF8_9BACI|nr:hypothetical protein [Terrilactibacillus laevilacticus]